MPLPSKQFFKKKVCPTDVNLCQIPLAHRRGQEYGRGGGGPGKPYAGPGEEETVRGAGSPSRGAPALRRPPGRRQEAGGRKRSSGRSRDARPAAPRGRGPKPGSGQPQCRSRKGQKRKACWTRPREDVEEEEWTQREAKRPPTPSHGTQEQGTETTVGRTPARALWERLPRSWASALLQGPASRRFLFLRRRHSQRRGGGRRAS